MLRLSLSSIWMQLVELIVNLWKIVQAFWMIWQIRWYRSMFKLFKQVNKPGKTTEFYCPFIVSSLTFLKLLSKWAFLWGVTEMTPNIIQKLETHAGIGNFAELLNFAVRQGNKDLEDHLNNCSSRETYISKTNLLNCCYDLMTETIINKVKRDNFFQFYVMKLQIDLAKGNFLFAWDTLMKMVIYMRIFWNTFTVSLD